METESSYMACRHEERRPLWGEFCTMVKLKSATV